MIVFGYKKPQSGFLKAIPFLALGAAMCLWPDMSLAIVVQIIGSLVILIGVVSAMLSFRIRGASGAYASMLFSSVMAVLFGVLLLMNPGFFARILMYVIGIVLLLFGSGQVAVLMSAREYIKVNLWGFILPLLSAVSGLVILFNPFESMRTIMLFMGAAVFLYGVSSLITAFRMRTAMKKFEQANSPAPDLDVDEEGFSSYEDVSEK